jgi:hypothetical protein
MVVVVDELRQDPAQVALAHRNQVVEALPAGGPHPAFGDGVGAGRLNRCSKTIDRQGGRALAEVGAPDPVTVMDPIARLAVPGCGFDQLPPDPSCGRIGGHFEVDQLTSPMSDEEDDVEGLEGQGVDNREVGGRYHLSMVGKEGPPALAGRSRMAMSAVATDRARTSGWSGRD